MSAGLHRFLVSWVSLFFLSDTDFIRSVLARSGLHTVREDRRHRPDLHRSELSFTSPRELPDAQAVLAGGISPLGQTPRSERRLPHPPGTPNSRAFQFMAFAPLVCLQRLACDHEVDLDAFAFSR